MAGWTCIDKDLQIWDGTIEARNGINSPRVIANTIKVNGTLDIIHTAEETDDHAVEIDLDAAGFGDVKALDIAFVTGAIGTGEDEEPILINIDQTLSTGGDINGVEVLTTEGFAVVHGLEVGAQVGPIDQISGAFVDMDSILVAGDNKLNELKDGGAGGVSLFVANADTVIIGDAEQFEEMEFILNTGASGAGIKPKFEFSSAASTWTEFSPADGTNAFRNTGVMLWVLADIPTWAVHGGEYKIRITRQRNSLSTVPICDKVQIVKGIEYSWDKDGVITSKNVSGVDPVTNAIRVTGEYMFTEDNELDYSASFTDGMAAATITFSELPSNTVAIYVDFQIVDTGTNPFMKFKRSLGGTEVFAVEALFADGGANRIRIPVWLPTSGNTIRITAVQADNTREFKIIGYKVGE